MNWKFWEKPKPAAPKRTPFGEEFNAILAGMEKDKQEVKEWGKAVLGYELPEPETEEAPDADEGEPFGLPANLKHEVYAISWQGPKALRVRMFETEAYANG